jgi:hypothetical protein
LRAICGCRHECRQGLAENLAKTLVVYEEKELVLDHRSAKAGAIIVQVERGSVAALNGRASNMLLRTNSNAAPWNAFVPVRETISTWPPGVNPLAAE